MIHLYKTQALLLAAVAAAIMAAAPVASQASDSVVVLVNARNPTKALTRAQLRNMFLGTTGFWHGVVPVKVFVRATSTPAAKAFFEPFVGQSPQAFAKHWDKLQLSGRGVAPTTASSAQDLAAKIAAVPGGIGFSLASEVKNLPGVKVVTIE